MFALLLHATQCTTQCTESTSFPKYRTKSGYAQHGGVEKINKKAVLPQGNRAMPQVFFSVEVRQQHSLQV